MAGEKLGTPMNKFIEYILDEVLKTPYGGILVAIVGAFLSFILCDVVMFCIAIAMDVLEWLIK